MPTSSTRPTRSRAASARSQKAAAEKEPSAIPANVRKPQDRQTAKDDVEPKVYTFEWEDRTYEVDSENIDDLDFLELMEQNRITAGLRFMLGEDQYTTFKEREVELHGKASGTRAFKFLDEMQKQVNRGN